MSQLEMDVINPKTGESSSCAKILKVLAGETRLAIVEQLMDGPRNVAEINEQLGVEQTLLSHHLKVLRQAGLVNCERRGSQIYYSLEEKFCSDDKRKAIDLGCCAITFE